ncbi:MAG: hypothetical protein U1E45_05790 [Geminicoccaceae bacterium]
MIRAHENSIFFLLFFVAAVLTGGRAEAAKVISQTPCSGTCAEFYVSGGTATRIPTIASFSFDAPARSTALVTFNGSAFCNLSAEAFHGVVDLVSQITTGTAAPSQAGPGGARHTMVLTNPSLDLLNFLPDTVPLNVAATRAITYATAGRKTVYFKVARLRMDDGTSCAFTNTAFTVLLIP